MNLAYIPVRGGSKSIPNKNIKFIAGKPLVYWVTKAASDCNKIDAVFVGSDSEEILELVASFNLPKVEAFTRSSENATDTSSSESALFEFINKKSGISLDDTITFIQATSPLLSSSDLDRAFLIYKEGEYDSLLSAVRSKRFYWNEDGQPLNYDYKSRPRRQDFDGTFVENGAFYINTVENIKKHENRLSGKIGIVEMPEYTNLELDEEEDWIAIEALMVQHNSKIVGPEKIKLFITDVDGVLTDAGMYYTNGGEESKKFNTRDGMAFELLRKAGIKTAIITSEDTKIVADRAKKIKADFLYQGIMNKVEVVEVLCRELGIGWENIAYIGDDINDVPSMKRVGFAFTPNDGQELNKSVAQYICKSKGGEGCVRESVEFLLKNHSNTNS